MSIEALDGLGGDRKAVWPARDVDLGREPPRKCATAAGTHARARRLSHAGRAFRLGHLVEDRRGAAYVEFLLAFMPLFILFLGMVQMALMFAGDLVVQRAASTAARAAAVVIDDDPQYYGGAARMDVGSSGTASSDGAMSSILSLFGGGGGGGGGGGTHPGGARMTAIRNAASIPLMAVSPSMGQLTNSDSVRTAIGDPTGRATTGLLVYNNSAMAVTFPTGPGSTSYRTSFSPGDQAVTRVTYLFHCGVPVVNRMMCETYPSLRLGPAAGAVGAIVHDLGTGAMSYDDAMAALQRVDRSRSIHQRDSAGVQELESAGTSDLMYLTAATGSRFKVLRAEASMPVQYARYQY